MHRAFGSFSNDERGSIAIIFAVSVLTLFAIIGMAIDYGMAFDRRAKLNSAADSAALAASKAAGDAFKDGKSSWESEGIAAGTASFTQNTATILGGADKISNVSVVVRRSGNEFSTSVSYQAVYPTTIMQLFHHNEIELSNSVMSKVGLANYIDVTLLIDASPSMGIGATLADQTTMQNAVGCALACHQQAGHLEAVRAAGARTRIDIVRDAARRFVGDLKSKQLAPDQVRVAIYLFSNDIYQILAPTTNFDTAYAATANIDLMTYPAFGTNSAHALSRLNALLPSGGDGYRETERKSFVVLLSDGIEDSRYQPDPAYPEIVDPNFVYTNPYYLSWSERLQSMESGSCDEIKTRNHSMITAHIEYLVPPPWTAAATPRFDFIRNNLIAKSITEYRACASQPSMAFTASESADILPMFDNILSRILAPTQLKLTQ